MGAPAEDPVRLLNLSLLQFQSDLAESHVLRQAQVTGAFRCFLDLSLESPVPVPSLLAQFRKRLGVDRCPRVFNEILRPGRAQGLVNERRRLKAATPLIANSALPSTRRLVAQPRAQVLAAAEGFAASAVAAHRVQVAAVRKAPADWQEAQRLLARGAHLGELGAWGEQWQRRLRQAAAGPRPLVTDAQAAAGSEALAVAHKVLNDRAPQAPDKLLALADRDARTGNHGDYDEGSWLDVSLDADSELSCAVAVLPANGDAGANATHRSVSEEPAHGTDSAALSVDRLGYRGAVLAELSEAADGPQLPVYVPPIDWPPPAPELWQPAAFIRNEAGEAVRWPGGTPTGTRKRAQRGHGGWFRFPPSQGRTGPLRAQWLKPEPQGGRTVLKNDYEAQSRAAQQRAQTAAYHEVRRAHPRIERKLAAMIRWPDGRRGRYRGRRRVKIQYLLTAAVVNCNRIVKLLSLSLHPQPAYSAG